MRAGELGGIRDDAMYRVGDTWWLRIPVGKLHNDRNVPLHPLLVGLINDYQAWRGPSRERVPPRTRRRPALRPAHHPPLRRTRRPAGRHRQSSPAPASSHAGHPVPQPGHEPRSDRRPVGAPLAADDPRLRPHLRRERRRPVLQRHPGRRSRRRTTASTAPQRPASGTPRTAAGQRALHPTGRAGLPLPDHLRRLRLLRDQRRVRRHPAPPTTTTPPLTPMPPGPSSTTSWSRSSTPPPETPHTADPPRRPGPISPGRGASRRPAAAHTSTRRSRCCDAATDSACAPPER